MEDVGRGAPAECLAGPVVEALGDVLECGGGVDAQVGPFGEILAQQPVGVFVAASLPRFAGMGEEDALVEQITDPIMGGHLAALVPDIPCA